MSTKARVAGIDVARGIASITMIQGHAFDGWATDAVKRAPLYAIEAAFLQTLALPAFLVLAGAGLAMRVEAAVARAEPAAAVRAALARRGGLLVLGGYALSALSALLDGWEGPETWLRADVLHVIGLSIALVAVLGVRGEGAIDGRWLARASAALVVVPVLVCAPLARATRGLSGPVGWVVGPFSDVPEITRMPVVPLVAWVATGVLVGRAWAVSNRAERHVAGAPPRVVGLTFALACAVACAGTWGEGAVLASLGGTLSRAHPAVVLNALQLAARGVALLAAAAWIAPRLAPRLRRALVTLGQGSLWAYAFHVPFCYGAPGTWLGARAALSGPACAAAATGLVVVSGAVVFARDAVRRARVSS